jgi:hypothetical protein
MPESFTKWSADRYTEKNTYRQWEKHVTSPPVIDKDATSVNISHAYSGSSYYTLCRNTPGFSSQEPGRMLECFVYAVAMSTFWEYVPEAFMEIPSIQDLIVTPVGGAILGELFHQLQRKIEASGGEIFGSKLLGKFVVVLLNPMEEAVQALQKLTGPLGEKCDIRLQMIYGNFLPDSLQPSMGPTRTDSVLQFQVTGKWPGKHADRRK